MARLQRSLATLLALPITALAITLPDLGLLNLNPGYPATPGYQTTPQYTTTPAYPTCDPTTVTVTATSTVTTTVAPTCPPTPTLTCDKYGYLIQYNSLYRVDLQTGGYEQVASAVSKANNVNAIGYNTLDNYLYGIANPSRQLIQISSTGTSTIIKNYTNAQIGASANVGDFDDQGYFWFGSGGTTWHQADLRDPRSATYGSIVASGTADTLGLGLADWVYIPVAGQYLWSVATGAVGGSQGTSLLRFGLQTKRWESVARYGVLAPGGYGALYGINNGTIYASNNENGEIWAFDVSGRKPYLASQGPKSGSNDGARCVLNTLA
ncbi:hypothetical protein F5Y19DRAFT_459167 [Xylariaceae sp. FL1651]|nr:hypothetical protein F5Y19DRAFT_459167 [Xylariaceae sp. FL1651]